MPRNNVTTLKALHTSECKSPLKTKKNAETKHHPNSVATGAAGLLRRMPAGWFGTKIRGTTKKLKGDTCLHRYDGSADTTWYQSEGQ